MLPLHQELDAPAPLALAKDALEHFLAVCGLGVGRGRRPTRAERWDEGGGLGDVHAERVRFHGGPMPQPMARRTFGEKEPRAQLAQPPVYLRGTGSR